VSLCTRRGLTCLAVTVWTEDDGELLGSGDAQDDRAKGYVGVETPLVMSDVGLFAAPYSGNGRFIAVDPLAGGALTDDAGDDTEELFDERKG